MPARSHPEMGHIQVTSRMPARSHSRNGSHPGHIQNAREVTSGNGSHPGQIQNCPEVTTINHHQMMVARFKKKSDLSTWPICKNTHTDIPTHTYTCCLKVMKHTHVYTYTHPQTSAHTHTCCRKVIIPEDFNALQDNIFTICAYVCMYARIYVSFQDISMPYVLI
jgi:hypothetical protein